MREGYLGYIASKDITRYQKWSDSTRFATLEERTKEAPSGDTYKIRILGQDNSRGYIPKIFALENPYSLNPEESDLFYFLLIRPRRPKSPKFRRAVSSSYKLHAIQCIPRDTTTLAFLLIIIRKVNTRGMRNPYKISLVSWILR